MRPPSISTSGPSWLASLLSSACAVPGGDAGNCVNILQEAALRATNSTDIRSACAILELAANAGALSMVVCANQCRPGKVGCF